jgi:hypothetical protein
MINTNIEKKKLLETIAKYFIPHDTTTPVKKALYAMNVLKEPDFEYLIKQMGSLGLMLCGGSVTSLFTNMPINDLDFYIKDSKNIPVAIEFLEKWFPEIPYKSMNAVTFKRKSTRSNKVWCAQLITRFTGTPEEIFDDFDFTITQGCYDFELGSFVFGERFLQDIAKRRITYLGKSHFPICALYRTRKYQAKGYFLPGSTVMHIALSIVQLKISNYGELKQQLSGIDTCYLQNLLNQEKYGDALPVNYGEFLKDVFDSINGVDPEADIEDEA